MQIVAALKKSLFIGISAFCEVIGASTGGLPIHEHYWSCVRQCKRCASRADACCRESTLMSYPLRPVCPSMFIPLLTRGQLSDGRCTWGILERRPSRNASLEGISVMVVTSACP